MSSACFSCQILMKLQFSKQIFEKHSNIKFQEKLATFMCQVSENPRSLNLLEPTGPT